MLGKSLVPIKAGTAPAIVTSASLPKTISTGIADLMIAYQTGNPGSTDDRMALLRIYGEAVDGFPVQVVAHALQWLKLHNPRNPFRPTPQDVFEKCEGTFKTWKGRVESFFLYGDDDADRWGPSDIDKMVANMRRHGDATDYGPQPLTPGSYLPDAIVIAILRECIAKDGYAYMLTCLRQVRFDAIPHEAFPPGKRDEAIADRKHKAYLDAMEPDLRQHRRWVISRYESTHRPVPPEAEIIEEAKRDCEADKQRRLAKYGRQVEAPVEEAAA